MSSWILLLIATLVLWLLLRNKILGESSARVTVYDDYAFKGRSSELGLGKYAMRNMGIDNDSISSLRVPAGLKVTLYENDNFNKDGNGRAIKGSRTVTLTADVEDLRKVVVNPVTGTTADKWTSSLEVATI